MAYGFYSVRQAKVGGTVWYWSIDGSLIEVTQVDAREDYVSRWDDMVCLGEVTTFVRRGSKGTLDDIGEEPSEENIRKLLAHCEEGKREEDRCKKKERWN